MPRMLQYRVPDNPSRSSISIAQQRENEMFMNRNQARRSGASAHADTPVDQAEPRGYPAGTPNSLQAHFALLGGPDVWKLASRFLSDMKPRAHRLRRKSADDDLDLTPLVPDDAADLVILRDTDRKTVQMHPAAAEVERVRSQKAVVQRVPLRDSNDSGYYSVGSNQHPPPLPQPLGTSTAASSTLASSTASTCHPASIEPSLSSPPSEGSE